MTTLVAVGPGKPAVPQTAVRIEPDGRPESATRVRIGTFDGPLALLLSLIEQRELDVRSVPLGDLAAGYLEALASLEGDRVPHLSAFTAVAAQLILIKSRAILPEPPQAADGVLAEEIADPAEELRRRLIVYRAYRDAARALTMRMDRGRSYRREPTPSSAEAAAAAYPSPAIYEPRKLVRALERSLRHVPEPEPPPQIVPRTITLAERADIIRDALRSAPLIVLQELLQGVRDRVVLAVTFLALLELVKRREVSVEQSEPWGAIRLRRLETHAT